MSTREKAILMSSVLLAATCVISCAFFVMTGSSGSPCVNGASLLFITLVSVISVVAVYFLRVRKSQWERLLNRDYLLKYEVIKDAVANSQLSNRNKREIGNDVLDLLISAQGDGKPADEVVGNAEIFAQRILASFTSPIRLAVLSMYDGVVFLAVFLIGANMLQWLENASQSFFDIRTDLSLVVFFAIVAFALLPLTRHLTARQNPWFFGIPLAFGVFFIVFAQVLRKHFLNVEVVKIFLDGTLNVVPNPVTLVVYLLAVPGILLAKTQVRRLLMRG